jgi:peroxiredoxin
MTKSLKITLIGIALAIAAVGAYFAFAQQRAMPEVKFSTLNGELIASGDLRGKVTLVNFWATSCVTCVAEMPRVISTYNKFKDRGFETIAVAMEYDPPNYVKNYAERNKLPFKVALDARGDLAKSFGDVSMTPTTFIVDKKGRIIKSYLGEPDFAKLHALLDAALKEAS